MLLSGVLSLSFWGSSVEASSSQTSLPSWKIEQQDEKNRGKVFVFKEGTNVSSITQAIQELDKHAKIETLDAISTLTVHPSSEAENLKVSEFIQNEYQNTLETEGEEQTVSVGDVHLAQPDLSMYTSMSFATAAKNAKETEESIYDLWNWDIKAVTENGASLAIESGNHDIKIGIIDSGIDFNHPDLKENIISKGKSFVDGVTDTQDYLGHGTMVAGSIAANGNLQGIAPHIGIVPYKVFHTGNTDSTDVIKAIIEAANDGMDVINLSLGTYKSIKNKEERAVYNAYERAVKYAVKKNTFVVASSGTELVGLDISNPLKLAEARGYNGDLQYHMPGGLKDVYTVAGTNKDGFLAGYSNYGKNVSIGAPGGDYGPLADQGILDVRYMTLTTYPTNLAQSITSEYAGFEKGYEFMIGTSLAAPKVSATAAVIIAEYQEKYGEKPKVKDIEQILDQGANKTITKHQFGAGIVNAYQSLKLINKRKK